MEVASDGGQAGPEVRSVNVLREYQGHHAWSVSHREGAAGVYFETSACESGVCKMSKHEGIHDRIRLLAALLVAFLVCGNVNARDAAA